VPLQGRIESQRENGRPILAPFAVAHRNRVRCKVHILDPQANALMHAQPGAVHQLGHQPASALHHCQDALHLVAGQDHRHPLPALDALEPVHLPQRAGENAVVEKDDCVQGLRFGRRGDAALDRQVV
jgi:hypothetical protein